MARNFNELRAKMSPQSQARAHRKAEAYRSEMALDELRRARDLTQESLANALGINQAAVSKIEHRTDMYISTLQAIVKAMGGSLVIQARFPEGSVEINQFKNLQKTQG